MDIEIYILGELQTNCYLVYDEGTKEGIIIDPADEANFISEQILGLGVKPTAIIATHGHFDHLLASYELQLAFNIPLLIHQKDLFLVKNLQKNASFWTKRKIIEQPPQNIQFISEHDKNDSCQLKIIETPGHTPGSLCLYSDNGPLAGELFTGDTLFSDCVGRTDLSYSSEKDLKKSLEKLAKLPDQTIIYPGHGETTTLKEALKFL